MPTLTRIAALGAAKQTAKGTPNNTPTYTLGLLRGAVYGGQVEQEPEELAWSEIVPPYANRKAITPGTSFSTRAWARSLGLWLQACLGNRSTTGTGPYTHAFTPYTAPPATPEYFTLLAKLDSYTARLADARLSRLSLSWEANDPLEVELEWLALQMTEAQSWTAANDETAQPKFHPVGGTFQLDVASGTPAAAQVTGGQIQIDKGLQARFVSGSILPADIYDAAGFQIDVTLKVLTANLSEWRKALTGSGAGTSPASAPTYGSFSVSFTCPGSTETLTLKGDRVPFLVDFPEADPGGGPAELQVQGRAVKATTGDTFKATLVNGVASY
jgi:hypothetical protein